ncbi:hypothetical protein [Arenibacterium halophilum]|jgi:uncharacterized protein YjiS (DUF1127 family)|uniref:DUF1127 domain-containing protein n=1 Tax=Arenibacterium halophilum TaxID=2583821 RepID=A0ABY2X861_9RHOB|nr:hypothetical protein [Arenibacterium halophilum]MAY89382.1 hypothetical protein [Pseudooceanicola sp.]TMV11517.1 hypothetical protein FGK64_14655 [Arenibacterium halophilum]|tara:strand:- start:232 stop:453 length:222 start_codon:yes stop_codon:yes gene_type:complete
MATVATATPTSGVRTSFQSFRASLATAFAAYLERRTRTDEIERLNALSDKELSKMGLRREDIARHVFRDLFYI